MADIKSGQDVTALMAGIKSGDDVTALMGADVGSSTTVPEPPRGRDFKIFGVNIHVPAEDKPRLDSNIATVGGVGIAPEDALMVGQAAKGIAAATSAGGMVAGLKEAVKTANPVIKFEVSRRALKAVGVPDGVAEVIAFGVSGYRRGGKPPVPEGPVSEPGYPRASSTPAPPPTPVEPPAHLDLSQRVPAGGLTQQQIAERLAATRAQGMTAPQVEPVMAQRPSPSSVPVPEGPPEPSMAKPAAEPFNPPRVKSPQQTLNEEAIARRRAAYQASQQPAYTKEVVHITTPEAAKGIKDTGFDVNRGQGLGGDKYGPGVYLADKQSDMGGYWRSQLETKNPTGTVPTESMSGDVTLSRPFVYEYNKYGNGAEVVGRISPREALGAKRPDLLQKYDALVKNGSSPNEALGETVRSSGYDGLVVKHRAGDEIVAFDAKSVKFSEPTAKDYDPAAELARILGTPSDAERRFPPNKSGLPSNPPTARKAMGKVADLAEIPATTPTPPKIEKTVSPHEPEDISIYGGEKLSDSLLQKIESERRNYELTGEPWNWDFKTNKWTKRAWDVIPDNDLPYKQTEAWMKKIEDSFHPASEPSNPPTARKARGKVSDLADIPQTSPVETTQSDSVRAYHGTRSASQMDSIRASTGGEFGPGIYLTKDPGTAEFFATHVARGPDGPSIVPVDVTLKNPFRVSKTDWIKMTERSTPSTVQKRLMAKGYDGIIGTGLTGQEQIVAFDPKQVNFALSHTR